ncbi:Uncharacterized protein APZ42_011122 [Daphnia magna]|uniref:Uncharacterized protein n=1 Tax=Daphnia magna TaxID=35525 RepID=A0A162T784_9CRUS|nr:Uncharacterized protein APZ42_011122 [Daphnia magna]
MFSYIGPRVDTRPHIQLLLLLCHKFLLRRPSVWFDRKYTEQDLPSRLRSFLCIQGSALHGLQIEHYVLFRIIRNALHSYSPIITRAAMSGKMTVVQWHNYWLLLVPTNYC